MAFCGKCGASVPDGATFCGKCGQPVGAAAPSAPAAAAGSSGMTSNVAGALTYLLGWITAVIFLVIEPYNKDKFVRFHAFQSLFLNIALIPIWIVVMIFFGILGHFLWFVIPLLWGVLVLAWIGLWFFLMYQAYSNKQFKLPVIGDLAAKQAG